MITIRALAALALLTSAAALAGCSSTSDVSVRSSAQPRMATWRCTGGTTLTIRNLGGTLQVEDSRGPSVELPPDPPGQRERYGATGYALVFDGRNASWFAGGQRPTDCRR